MLEADFIAEVAAGGLEGGFARFGDGAVGCAVFCRWQSRLGLLINRRKSLHHCG